MGQFHAKGILTNYKIASTHTAVFLNDNDETSLFLNKKHSKYDVLFKKITELKNKKVIITYGSKPGFRVLAEIFLCFPMYDYIYDIEECNDNQYEGKIKHVVKLPDTNFYEIIFTQSKYGFIFIIDSNKYEQYKDSIEIDSKCVINFNHYKGDYYVIQDIAIKYDDVERI